MRTLLCLTTLAALNLTAQEPPPRPDGPRPMMRPYDATKEATYKATVSEVKETKRGDMSMVLLVVKVDDKELHVNVGPEGFLKEKQFTFTKGDALTIVGIKQASPRGEAISAREITKGKETLTIRGKDGRPLWMPASN